MIEQRVVANIESLKPKVKPRAFYANNSDVFSSAKSQYNLTTKQ